MHMQYETFPLFYGIVIVNRNFKRVDQNDRYNMVALEQVLHSGLYMMHMLIILVCGTSLDQMI